MTLLSFYAGFGTIYHPLLSKPFSLGLHDITFSWVSAVAGYPASAGLSNVGLFRDPPGPLLLPLHVILWVIPSIPMVVKTFGLIKSK